MASFQGWQQWLPTSFVHCAGLAAYKKYHQMSASVLEKEKHDWSIVRLVFHLSSL